MTAEMMSLQALLEKSSDTELLREMISFAAQRLMELEVEAPPGRTIATATASATGRRVPAPWSCASPSCAAAATFRAFWSRAGWLRRR